MKLFVAAIASFLLCTANFAQTARVPKIYAMVVGVSKYIDGSIPNLKYAEKDATLFYDFLRSANAGGIPEQNIVLLTNEKATRANILKELVQLLSRSTPEDMVIFYFSGHGKNDVLENSGFLLTYDTENENETVTALSMSEIGSKLDRCKAKMKVSYLDACHAGLFKTNGARGTANDNGEIVKAYTAALNNAGEGNVAFLASSARQQSLEDDKLSQGIFTYYLIKGLKGEADQAQKEGQGFNNGIVTAGELQTYLTANIEAATKYKQKPMVSGDYDEDFPLSVLRSNIVLSTEISKRSPRVKKTEGSQEAVTPATYKVPPDELLSTGMTLVNRLCHGQYSFINMTKTSLLLYAIRTRNGSAGGYGGVYDVNIKIAPAASGLTPRLYVFQGPWADQISQCNDLADDYDFYFKKVGEDGVERYAQVTATVESRKKRYLVLSDDNVNFTTRKPF